MFLSLQALQILCPEHRIFLPRQKRQLLRKFDTAGVGGDVDIVLGGCCLGVKWLRSRHTAGKEEKWLQGNDNCLRRGNEAGVLQLRLIMLKNAGAIR